MKSRIINLNKTRTYNANNLIPNGIDVLEEISSEDGMFLTQSADVDIRERIVGTGVMLGRGCSSDEWKEITKEEADTIKAEQEKAFEEDEIKDEEEMESNKNLNNEDISI